MRSGGCLYDAHDTAINQPDMCAIAHKEPLTMPELLGIHQLWLFVLSGLLLNITPGPDTAYIIGRSIQFGWRGGAAAAAGICSDWPGHGFLGASGALALLMASC